MLGRVDYAATVDAMRGFSEQRGEATADEANALIEEGIEVFPLPRLPEDGN